MRFQSCQPLVAAAALAACSSVAPAVQSGGFVVCWGDNSSSQQCEVPPGLNGVIKIAAGSLHSVALRSDGTVVCWGWTTPGCAPPGLDGVIDVTAGATFAVALRSDGSVVAWGDEDYTSVPTSLPPVVKIASGPGAFHTSVVTSTGEVVAWGDGSTGQLNIPSGLAAVADIAVAGLHNVALASDGSVVCWGWNYFGQCNVPADLPPVHAVAAGVRHSVALLADGTVRCWGYNASGQCSPPPLLGGVIGIAAGDSHSVALVAEDSGTGRVQCWGGNWYYGECAVPDGLRGVVQLAAGSYHTLALVADCNGDGVADSDQCRDGSLPDYDSDNVPDCCEEGTPCDVGNYPVQWRVQDGGNGHWYAFVRDVPIESLSWTEAHERSVDVGGYLACVQSSAENDFLWTLIRIGDHLSWGACGPRACGPFLGGYRTDVGDDPALGWRWVDGSSWGFTRWAPTEPANGGGVQNYLKYWFDLSNPAPDWGDDSIDSSDAFFIEWSDDCNGDGYVDFGQIMLGELADVDQSGVPDSCEPAPCPGDVSGDGVVDGVDLASVLGAWGTSGEAAGSADVNSDGLVEGKDLAWVIGTWGPCVTVPAWATLVEAYPDPSVVHDPSLRASINATGLAWRVRDAATQIELVLIPPGSFEMGCSPSNQYGCSSAENPVHTVTLTNAFYMGRYEVTQVQWTGRMGANPSHFSVPNGYADADHYPVDSVSWEAVQEFVSLVGMRLPTEAEWEHACRAGTQTAFHGFSGYPDGTDDDNVVDRVAWFRDNSGLKSNPVGQRSANGLGVHDMSGNIWEWVGDWWSASYYSVSPSVNPQGPREGSYRVIRGGAWNSNTNIVRTSYRSFYSLGSTSSNVGFRVARNP